MSSTDYLKSHAFLARAARARRVLAAGRERHEREICAMVTGIDVDSIEIAETEETMLELADRLHAACCLSIEESDEILAVGDVGRAMMDDATRRGIRDFVAAGGRFAHRGPHLSAVLRDIEILTDVPGTTLRHYAHAAWRWHQATIMIFSEKAYPDG